MESRRRIAHSISKHGVTVLTLLCMVMSEAAAQPGGGRWQTDLTVGPGRWLDAA